MTSEDNADVLNDMCSGLFTMSFALGEVFGPLLGNYMYIETGFASTCDCIGISLILYAIIYFLA
jgi:hypothetical protein